MDNPFDSLMLKLQPIMDHVMANALIYGIGAVVALIIIYFTRPYSTSIIFYGLEILVYLFSMHTAIHVIVKLLAWFSNQTTMKNVFENNARDAAVWTTPWPEFWDRIEYDPSWIIWMEVVFAIIIIGLVQYFRPMKVQKKKQSSTAPPKKKPKKKGRKGDDDDDDDGWGVPTTRRFTIPDEVRDSRWK